jgi:ATP-binding cassette subfamily B (MDR/TAP) protein 1
MTHIRTVESFGYEDIVLRKYDKKLEEPFRLGVKKGNVSGLLFGISQLIMFTVFGLIFFLGTVFKRDNNLQIDEVFTAIYSIFFAAMTVGNNSHFLPDIEEGKLAAARLFDIIDS